MYIRKEASQQSHSQQKAVKFEVPTHERKTTPMITTLCTTRCVRMAMLWFSNGSAVREDVMIKWPSHMYNVCKAQKKRGNFCTAVLLVAVKIYPHFTSKARYGLATWQDEVTPTTCVRIIITIPQQE